MNPKLLQEYIGRDPVTRFDAYVTKGFAALKIPYTPKRSQYVGVEIEVEGIHSDAYRNWQANIPRWFDVHADGSLRDGGAEFITFPFDGDYSQHVLGYFFEKLSQTNPGFKFTNRCSIHVHLDMTDTTYWQFESLYQLYLVFEYQFYQYAGEVREQSNFCVPVSETPFEEYLFSNVKNRSWSTLLNIIPGLDQAKYTGLNITRLRDLGTVEFRHLPGQKRVPIISKFIQFILALKRFAMSKSREEVNNLILNANTISNYQPLAESIFGEHTRSLFPTGEFNLIEEGITTAKRLYFDRSMVDREAPLRSLLKSPTMLEKITKIMEEIEAPPVVETRPRARQRPTLHQRVVFEPNMFAQPVYAIDGTTNGERN